MAVGKGLPHSGGNGNGRPHAAGSAGGAGWGESPIRFGRFELDLEQEELRRNGRPVKLQDQPFRLLRLLALHPGKVVRREEIRETLWDPGTWVDFEQGINHCIRQLRSVLGDDAEAPRFIETLPRKGYRFIAEVERGSAEVTPLRALPRPSDPAPAPLQPATDPAPAPSQPASEAIPRARSPVRPALLVSAALVAVAALLVAALRGEPPAERPAQPAADGRRVLAILPFANLTGDPGNDYLGEGLTEELITRLGQRYSRKLAVIAPTSVRGYGKNLPPADEIGRKLGADYILQGSIRRGAGRLRVTAQLVRARDRTDLWATNYDRPLDDPIEVQTEVSKRISEALALQILDPGDREGLRAAALPAAYDKYLRGRHLLHSHRKVDAEAALADLQAAVTIDPAFARGWSSLALALRQQDLPREEVEPRAREAALKALSLDDSDEEAWLTLAMIRFYNDLDPEGAKIAFERAIESQPDYAEAYHHFAAYWSIRGEHDKAIASVQHALALDPLSPAVNADVGWYYYYARRYDEAIAASKRTLEISPRYIWAHRSLILSYLAKGDDRSALEAARSEMEQRGAPADAIAAVDPDHPGPGLKAYWLWDLRRWDAASVREKVQPAVVGLIYASLGYRDAALFTLEKACDARAGWMTPFLRVDPLADPLRSDPRFQALIQHLDTIASVRASLWSSAPSPPGSAGKIASAARPAGRVVSQSRPVVYP